MTHTFNLPLLTDSNNPLSTLPSSICGRGYRKSAGLLMGGVRVLRISDRINSTGKTHACAPTHEAAGLSCVREKTGKRQKISNVQVGRNFERRRKSMKCPDEAQFSIISSKNDSQGCAVCRFIFSPHPPVLIESRQTFREKG